MAIVAILLPYLIAYKYIALTVATFISATLIPLPMSAVLLAAGVLGSYGEVDPMFAFVLVFAANTVGDVLEFWLARRYRVSALRLLGAQHSRFVERIRRSIYNYAAATIFLTRFVGGIPGNILTGFADVPLGQFVLFAALGNAAQVGAVLYLGYFGGDELQDFVQGVSVGWWILVFLVLLAGIGYVLSRRRR